jgi:SAM-dependent methyltransferase
MIGPPNASLRFGEAADAYERGRPSYPARIVAWLIETTSGRIIDLGAGTGKLTRDLMGLGRSVIAVEPDPVMRRALATRLPRVPVLAGTAERIPLPDGCAGLVVAAQAWHWVDPARAIPEVARVLTSDGALAMVWNDRDDDDPWVGSLSVILREYGANPSSEHEPQTSAPFAPLERAQLSWSDEVSVDAVVAAIASRSYVIALDGEGRAELLDRVRRHAESAAVDGAVSIRYVTRAYRTVLA